MNYRLPHIFETAAPASVAPVHHDDVTIAAACWALVQEISGDGVWNVEVWRNTHGFGAPLADKQPCCVTVFGPWGETESRLFDAPTHFDALTSAAEAVREKRARGPELGRTLADLLEASGDARCACTAKQIAGGHKTGCWYPKFSASIEAARKAVAS